LKRNGEGEWSEGKKTKGKYHFNGRDLQPILPFSFDDSPAPLNSNMTLSSSGSYIGIHNPHQVLNLKVSCNCFHFPPSSLLSQPIPKDEGHPSSLKQNDWNQRNSGLRRNKETDRSISTRSGA